MKLWLISQEANDGYDTYDSAVVQTETEEEARAVLPHSGTPYRDPERARRQVWAPVADVKVEYLGEAMFSDRPNGTVICASFNAG